MRGNLKSNPRLLPGAFIVASVLAAASCTSGAGGQQPGARAVSRAAQPLITNVNGTPIALTAQRMTTTLRDGTAAPMWGFCATGTCTGSWAPGPTIVAAAGDTVQITLTNALPVPTSLVVLGQAGGGLGAPVKMASPAHPGQSFTTFPGNAPAGTPFVPPTQADRVRSFGTEVAPLTGTQTLTWTGLKPGTYLYETGTLPSLEVPMGLYGMLVVTTAPTATAPGTAYPGISYDDDVALLFSELDPVQNAAVDAAALAGTDVNLRFNDPACGATCYPAAVNYTPTYFLINGKPFDAAAPDGMAFKVGDTATYSSGKILLRLANAGSRTHIPALVGLPMPLVAEDGNPLPGTPRVQTEVLLTAGKTYDLLLAPPAAAGGTGYAPGTFPIFDRALFLSTANKPSGGMQGFLLINHAGAATTTTTVGGVPTVVPVPGAPGNLPAAVTPTANPDSYKVPYNGSVSNNVTANDVAVTSVALGAGPSHGTLSLAPDGTFTYTPTAGYSGTDSFTYLGNGQASLTATATLTVAAQLTGAANTPVANPDTYRSTVAGKFSAARPGVLANDTDPNRFPLTAGSAVPVSGCGSVTLNADGSFAVTGTSATCRFSYTATNSQGVASAPAVVTVTFGAASNLSVAVLNGADGTALSDYRWTIQEDLTFKHVIGSTPATNTRTVGTSFHRSHMPTVATGCVGPVSCGSGQSVLDPTTGTRVTVSDADALGKQTLPSQVALDPTKHYYLSVLPGNAANGDQGNTIAGGELRMQADGGWAASIVTSRASPLPPAQMSIYVYEDNQPTNGQDEPTELPLGGFNIILFDPAGRTGDVAGQQTYDAFNMPLSNALLGSPGCPDTLNVRTNGTGTTPGGNPVGAIYTCPNDPNEGTPRADPVRYALAGHALIKNLTPARYDVVAHPGAAREGAGEVWWQTETLEGTPNQDAFVGFNEPVYFQEFGPPGPHVTIGFVNPKHVAAYAAANGATGTHTITGRVTNQHMSRPSATVLYDATTYDMFAATTCQVVLNSQSGSGPAIAAAQCAADGSFTLTNVPAGTFDLAVFDQWLDQIIQNVAVTVPTATASVDMGNLPVLNWFTLWDQNIFLDANHNGIFDDGETGIANVPLTVRFRDGSISNATLTDSNGNGTLPELFPLFNWYVAEADMTRFKQTGVHVFVDSGGRTDTTGPGANLWNSTYPTGQSSVRVDLGTGQDPRPATLIDGSEAQPAPLSYGFQGFISQMSRLEWGRAPYVPGENGGIQGTVVYASTRPFDDMRFNVQNIWAPLVPRVTVNLYRSETLADGTETLTLVDTTTTTSFDDYVNLVYGANGTKYLLGSDGKLRDPATGALAPTAAYPAGKQVNLQCPGQRPGTTAPPPWNTDQVDPFTGFTLAVSSTVTDTNRCYDGFHNWNQVQAAPYDGRFVFPSAAYVAAHPLTAAQKTAGQTLVSLPPGTYVVEEVTPPGFEVVKEEDKNILNGDAFVAPVTTQFGGLSSIFILPDQATLGNANPNNPSTGDPGFQSDPTSNLGVYGISSATIYPECVGKLHRVPDFLSLFPQTQLVAPFAGMDRPLCDRKKVVLNDQMLTDASFFIFTEVPQASNNTGIILDDASSEFNAVSPDFGEKASVPFVPVSVKDFTGFEIGRTYSDQWGAYNMMTPSSWLVNPPTPSGFGPNMLITCINDPGPIPDPANPGKMITDPAYNPAYSNFCYTNPYMPGRTTYLDTPVLPIAAFAAGYNPADCAQPAAAPVVKRVDSSAGIGPWLPNAGGTLTITAMGDVQVPNPAYSGPFATAGLASQTTVTRHYGFGTQRGTVRVGNVNLTGVTWTDSTITGTVPAGTPTGELNIVTAAGVAAVDTVTVTLGGGAPTRVSAGASIQAAIDAANRGDLIILDEGTYNELVVMWKPVRLQGVGAGAVIINAAKYPNPKLDAWRPLINSLFSVDVTTGNQIGTAQIDPLPTQEITGGVVLLEPSVLGAQEGAGITVLAKNLPAGQCGLGGGAVSTFGHRVRESNFRCAPSRIDGISVTGGDSGGGIYVNGWAHNLQISNNRIYGNAGAFTGGLSVGVPYLELETLPTGLSGGRIPGLGYNVNLSIHHNSITKNGTVEGNGTAGAVGAGVTICAGTDNYSVDHNYICGNYGASHGGGIGHLGFSQGGTISTNQILFNQSFQQSNTTHGGGIAVVGEPPIAGAVSLGTGDLTIDGNTIRGNLAEGGQGGGIRLQQVNGADVAAFNNPARWHAVTITNNIIDNNVAGWAGGGLSLADTLRATIVHNTVSSNDSTGIAGVVVAGGVPLPGPTPSVAGRGYPSPSGLVSELTSAQLLAQLPNAASRTANAISQPVALTNNVFWRNRSFYYSGNGQLCAGNSVAGAGGACTVLAPQSTTGQCVNGAAYWDIGVLADASPTPGAQRLNPTLSVLTSTAGYGGAGNVNTVSAAVVTPSCNGARVTPELGTVLNPPAPLAYQVAATLDEGNNYVNLKYGPLTTRNPVSGAAFDTYRLR